MSKVQYVAQIKEEKSSAFAKEVVIVIAATFKVKGSKIKKSIEIAIVIEVGQTFTSKIKRSVRLWSGSMLMSTTDRQGIVY